MAIKTYWMDSGTASGSNHHALLGTVPTGIYNFVTGWVVGTTPANRYNLMLAGVERGAASFITTPVPNSGPQNGAGDCFRTNEILNGTFAEGNWALNFHMVSLTDEGGGQGVCRVRLWKGSDPTGVGAVMFRDVFETSSFPNTKVVTNVSANPFVASTELKNEYLFVQVAYRTLAAGNLTTIDAHFRQTNTGGGSYIQSTEFSPTQNTSFVGFGNDDFYEMASSTDTQANPAPVGVILPSSEEIVAPSAFEEMSGWYFEATPGVVQVAQDGFEIAPTVDDDLEVSYNAKETAWQLGSYLI